MTDQPTPATPDKQPQTTQSAPAFDAEYVGSLRSESKKWRLRAREAEAQLNELREKVAAPAAAKAPAAEGDGLDDLRAELERMKHDLAAKDAALLRTRIASEMGLPTVLAERLRGDDEEALRADAEALKGLVAPAAAAPAAPRRPVTSVPNGLPATGKSEDDLRRQYLGSGGRDSVPVTQQEERGDGRIIFSSR